MQHFLEYLVANYGVQLYLVLVYLGLTVIVWMLARRRRERDQRRESVSAPSLIIVTLPNYAAPPVLHSARDFPDLPFPSPGDDENTAFCA